MAKHGTNWFQVYGEENANLVHDDDYFDPEMDNQRLPGQHDSEFHT